MRNDALIRAMPDIATQALPESAATLDWVGMDAIEVPVSISAPGGRLIQAPGKVSAYVNLNQPQARGIHMSRLYLHVDKLLTEEPLTPRSAHRLVRDFLDSHQGLSDSAWVRIRFDYMIRRPALVSDKQGWRSYPVIISATHERGHFNLELATQVVYSSTCPCSAALARQLIQEQFRRDFPSSAPLEYQGVLDWLGSEQGINATPHSQRSLLQLRARLLPSFADFPIVDLIDLLEGALATPVQTAVKREDEQAFACLNGANLMFCEDAGRRVRAALQTDERITDFWARAIHQESLHPHDAIAVVSKGIAGGYGAHTEWLG